MINLLIGDVSDGLELVHAFRMLRGHTLATHGDIARKAEVAQWLAPELQ